jgi:hypothetical protein
MAQNYKVLGQQNPTANTLTTLYTVPSSNQAVLSTVSICNLGPTPAAYSIAVRPAGASISNTHYVVYRAAVANNDSVMMTLGISLGNTDVLSVNANTSLVAFHAYGVEM